MIPYYTSTPSSSTITTNSTSSATNTVWINPNWTTDNNSVYRHIVETVIDGYKFARGQDTTIEMPDGSKITVNADGSYAINDKDAKVVYRAARFRDFNPFINASDKLEEFVRFCGQHGVRRGEMLELPVRLFIGWLVIEAAKADQAPEPEIKLLPDLRRVAAPHCRCCGRFIRPAAKRLGIEFCATECFDKQLKVANEDHPPRHLAVADRRRLRGGVLPIQVLPVPNCP